MSHGSRRPDHCIFMKLHHQARGSGPPMIFLHGLLGSLDNWNPVAQAFSDSHSVYCLDQRNHGASPHADVMDYPLMAEDLNEFFETHGIQSAVVVGHSMGGKVAMEFALRHPGKVEKLLVEDIAPRLYPASHVPVFKALQELDLVRSQTRADLEAALEPTIPVLSIRRFLLKNIGRNDQGCFYWKMNLHGLSANYHHLIQPVSATASFSGPACFIRGGQSRYVQDADVPLIQSLFPQARIQTIPDANHWIHFERLDAFLELARNFLSGKTPAPGSGKAAVL